MFYQFNIFYIGSYPGEANISTTATEICSITMAFVKEEKHIVKLYTGCPSAKIFEFIVDYVQAKRQKIHYCEGSNYMNADPKQYQLRLVKDLSQHKHGPSRILSLENEILTTLMRIRLDFPVEDLAFRFGVSVSLVTSIITTVIFLSLELKPLIYWHTPDETISYKHFHFNGTFDKCKGIGDCTEQWIEHSKHPDAQHQRYSSYKSNNTWGQTKKNGQYCRSRLNGTEITSKNLL